MSQTEQATIPVAANDMSSRERLEGFAEILNGWFWETDEKHRFIFMSASVETITGVPPEWHYGKTRRDIGVPDSVELDDWYAHLETLDRHEPFDAFVFPRAAPDGVKWMQTSGKPMFDSGGTFLGYRGIASDITAQVEAERRTETLSSAVEQLSDVFVLWGPDDRLVICNRQFREINSAVSETVSPGTLFETHIRAALGKGLYPDAAGREEAWLKERMARHRNPEGGFELQRQDGRWLWLNEQRLQNGSTLTISSDITELKRSQAKASEQANIIETSLRAMPDGMLVLDDDLEFVSWNNRLFEILDLNRELIVNSESPAKTFRYMMATRGEYGEGSIPDLVAEHEARIRSSEPVFQERQLASGRWVEIRNYPIPTGGYVAVFRDFTEQHTADRMKDEFISTVSHELRTPMTSILGSIGLLANGVVGKLPEQAEDLLQIAHNNGTRLLDLINDLLDIERLASGQMEYHLEPLDIIGTMVEAIEAHQGYAEQYGVSIDLSVPEEKAFVMADRARLLQVMANLLSNATKYSPEGGAVEVAVSTEADSVRIAVRDEGPGIPEDYQPYIFEKFTQADSSDTRRVGGTGLGLSICRAIVEYHNGDISFETGPETGTTFTVVLPLSEAETHAD